MSAQLDERIRQVAIILSSVDPNTASTLLSQLSPDQARSVLGVQETLGEVSNSERRVALSLFKNRVSRFEQFASGDSDGSSDLAMSLGNTIKDATHFSSSRPSETTTGSKDYDIDAVAMQFLDDDSPNDSGFSNRDPSEEDASQNTPTNSAILDSESINELVSRLSPAEIADLFGCERTIVVAILLHHLDDAEAVKTLQSLPQNQAACALAQLPNIKVTRPEIIEELRSLILDHFHVQTGSQPPKNRGLDRVRSILSASGQATRQDLLRGLSKVDSSLAQHVGWVSEPSSNPTLSALPQPSPDTSRSSTHSYSKKGILEEMTSPWHPIETSADANQNKESESGMLRSAVDAREINHQISFEQICELPTEDLSQVVQLCEPNVVLVLLTQLDGAFRRRVMPMFPTKDILRIKERLDQLGSIPHEEMNNAKLKIIQVAGDLYDQGKIGAIYSVTINSAA